MLNSQFRHHNRYNIVSRDLHAWHAKQSDEFRDNNTLMAYNYTFPFMQEVSIVGKSNCLGSFACSQTRSSHMQPGEKWEYACGAFLWANREHILSRTTGFDWLGRLIARKSGLSLPAYIQKHIAQPLNVRPVGHALPTSQTRTHPFHRSIFTFRSSLTLHCPKLGFSTTRVSLG